MTGALKVLLPAVVVVSLLAPVTPAAAAPAAAQHVADLKSDLRNVSISEESYATDYNGAFVADTLDRRGSKPLPTSDVLVKQGAALTAGDRVIATLFRQPTSSYDDYCLT